jgi:hypothetical protein
LWYLLLRYQQVALEDESTSRDSLKGDVIAIFSAVMVRVQFEPRCYLLAVFV